VDAVVGVFGLVGGVAGSRHAAQGRYRVTSNRILVNARSTSSGDEYLGASKATSIQFKDSAALFRWLFLNTNERFVTPLE
jgi:hypothetical protein